MNKGGIKDTFFEESRFLVSEMETLVLDLESEPDNKSIADSLFRVVHTIKGSAGMFGFHNAAELGHVLENIIVLIQDSKIYPNSSIADLFFECADEFKVLLNNTDIEGGKAQKIKEKVFFLLNLEDSKDESREKPKLNEYRIFFRPMEKIFEIGLDPYTNIEELIEAGECTIE